jgi:hypothetical protein
MIFHPVLHYTHYIFSTYRWFRIFILISEISIELGVVSFFIEIRLIASIFYVIDICPTQEPIMKDKTPELQPHAVSQEMTQIDSATLARLIEEVRNEDPEIGRSYDRTHNRHNR